MLEPGHDHKLQEATESTLAKAASRFLTPALLAVLAWFANQAFNDIRENQKLQNEKQQQQGLQLQLLSAKIDYSVLQQMESLNRRVILLEDQNRVMRVTK